MDRDVRAPRGGSPVPIRRRRPSRRRHLPSLAVAALALLALCAIASPAMADPTLRGSFDGSQTPAGSWNSQRLAVDESTGHVYVIDSADDVIDVFSSTGRYLFPIPGSLTTNHTFNFGGDDDVAVDNSGGANDGNVYVNAENAGLIFAFDRTGNFLWQSNAGVSDPCGIGVDSSGNPWFGDFNNGLQELSAADGSAVGSPILATGDSCHFAFDASDNVALNHWGGSVQLYNQAGTVLATIESQPSVDVAVDTTSDAIYDVPGFTVSVHDRSGNPIGSGSFGSGTIFRAIGVTANGRNSRIYVSDPIATPPKVWIYSSAPSHQVTATVNGSGSGRVDSDSSTISGCTSSGGAACSEFDDDAATVTLTGTPDAGSGAATWSGCDMVTGDDRCQVSINGDKNVTATFDVQRTLRVTPGGTGSGSVTSSPAGIDCGATCTALFDDGRTVTLTGAPNAGSGAVAWSGCDTVTGDNRCQVSMTGDKNVTATFAQDQPTVTTGSASAISQTGATVAGTVNPNGSNVTSCHVDYGTTTAYGGQAPCSPSPGSGSSAVSVSASLSGLTVGTTYHYRVVAVNAGGTTNGADATFATSSQPPPPGCPQDLLTCPAPSFGRTGFSSKTLLLTLKCTGYAGQPACSGKLTFKAVVKVRVKHGKKFKIVKRTITVATVSYSVAAGSTKGYKLKLTSAAKSQLKKGGLVATAKGLSGSIKLPKTKVKKKK